MIDDSCVEVLEKKQVRFLFATPTTMIYFGSIWLCKRACWRVLVMLKVIQPAEFLHLLRESSIIIMFLATVLGCGVV